jgi:hypothetical protein
MYSVGKASVFMSSESQRKLTHKCSGMLYYEIDVAISCVDVRSSNAARSGS